MGTRHLITTSPVAYSDSLVYSHYLHSYSASPSDPSSPDRYRNHLPFSSDSDGSRGRGRDRDQSPHLVLVGVEKEVDIEQLTFSPVTFPVTYLFSYPLPYHKRVHLFLTVFGGVLLECIAKSVCCTKFLPQDKLPLVVHLCQLLENFFENYN